MDWEPIRRAYVTRTSAISLRKLALEFGVHPSTVMRRSSLDGWRVEREQFQSEVRSETNVRIAKDQVDDAAAESRQWRQARAEELRDLALAVHERFIDGVSVDDREVGIGPIRATMGDYLRLTQEEGRLLGFLGRNEQENLQAVYMERWESLIQECGIEHAPGPSRDRDKNTDPDQLGD